MSMLEELAKVSYHRASSHGFPGMWNETDADEKPPGFEAKKNMCVRRVGLSVLLRIGIYSGRPREGVLPLRELAWFPRHVERNRRG